MSRGPVLIRCEACSVSPGLRLPLPPWTASCDAQESSVLMWPRLFFLLGPEPPVSDPVSHCHPNVCFVC